MKTMAKFNNQSNVLGIELLQIPFWPLVCTSACNYFIT